MTSLLSRPLTPAARRVILTPAPVRDDPRVRRYRLARVALETPRGTRAGRRE